MVTKTFLNSRSIITNLPGINLLIVSIISILLTAFHELGHFIAAIKYDIPVKFNISTRLIILVVEAKMNGIWSVPQKSRYIPLLGGAYFDIITFWISTVIVSLNPPSIIINICEVCIIFIITQFLFQFAIFFRTDLYFIIINFLHIDGLQSKVKSVLSGKNKLPYSIIYTVIAILGTISFIIYFITILSNSIYEEITLFYENLSSNLFLIKLDSLIGIGVISIMIIFTLTIIIKRLIDYKRSTT